MAQSFTTVSLSNYRLTDPTSFRMKRDSTTGTLRIVLWSLCVVRCALYYGSGMLVWCGVVWCGVVWCGVESASVCDCPALFPMIGLVREF